jgi:hypothetical protein
LAAIGTLQNVIYSRVLSQAANALNLNEKFGEKQ